MRGLVGSMLRTAAIALLATFALSATPITGQLHITGDVRIGADFANWVPLGDPAGIFNVEPSSTGDFTGLDTGTSDDGSITDLDAVNAPVGVPISVLPFLTFVNKPNIVFELTFIDNGAFAPCLASPTCSVNQFNLVQTGQSVTANFNVRGNVYDNGALASTFTGAFTQTFTNTTILAILTQIGQQGFIDTAFAGDFDVTPIPEPGTFALVLLPLAAVALRNRFRR